MIIFMICMSITLIIKTTGLRVRNSAQRNQKYKVSNGTTVQAILANNSYHPQSA